MCVICLQFAKNKNLEDAFNMIQKANSEPKSGISTEHLIDLHKMLEKEKEKKNAKRISNV